jgi:hypothetical protein
MGSHLIMRHVRIIIYGFTTFCIVLVNVHQALTGFYTTLVDVHRAITECCNVFFINVTSLF